MNTPAPATPVRFMDITIADNEESQKFTVITNCFPRDIYLLAENYFNVKDVVLVYKRNQDDNIERVLPRCSNLYLWQWHIRCGAVFTIHDIDTYFNLPPIDYADSEDIDMDTSDCISFPNLRRVSQLERQQQSIFSTLTSNQQIIVRRDHIVEDTLMQYKDPSILKCKFEVAFDDEKGQDMNGLTRELFSLFWYEAENVYFKGSIQKFPSLKPDRCLLDMETSTALGRILLHGYVLVGFLPLRFSHACLFYVLTGQEPTTDLLIDSFLQCIDENEKHLLLEAMKCNPDTTFQPRVMNFLTIFFGHNDISRIPSPATMKEVISNLSRYTLLMKPFYILQNMRSGVTACFETLFEIFSEKAFSQLLEKLRPKGSDIVKNLKPEYSQDGDQKAVEERVFGMLEDYIESY